MNRIARTSLLAACSAALAAALACGGGRNADQNADGGGAGDAQAGADAATDAGADGASADATAAGDAALVPSLWGCNVPPPTGVASNGPQPTWVVQGERVDGGDFVLGVESDSVPLAVDGTSSAVFAGDVLGEGLPGVPPSTIDAAVTFGGGGPVIPPGGAFLLRVDPQGATAWTKVLAATSPDGRATGASVAATATDASGRVGVAGWLTGSLDLGCGALTGAAVAGPRGTPFVAVLDAAGSCVWSTTYASPKVAPVDALALAFDASGDLVVVASSLGFGPGAAGAGLSIAKLDATGAPLWTVTDTSPQGAANDVGGLGVGVDAKGDIVVGANFGGKLTLGGQVFEHPSTAPGALLAKVTAAGSVAWAQSFGTSTAPVLQSMAVAPTGAIALEGQLAPGGALGACVPSASCGAPPFLTVLGPDGAVQWVRFFPSVPWVPSGSSALGMDPGGNVAVALSYSGDPCPCCGAGPLNLGGADLPTGATPPLIIAAYAADGTHRWDTLVPCTQPDGGGCMAPVAGPMAVSYLPNGDVVLAGLVGAPNTLAFGGTVVTSPPVTAGLSGNVFVARLH